MSLPFRKPVPLPPRGFVAPPLPPTHLASVSGWAKLLDQIADFCKDGTEAHRTNVGFGVVILDN